MVSLRIRIQFFPSIRIRILEAKPMPVHAYGTGYRSDLVFTFFRAADDFTMQNVYLLKLMPVCVGLIMLAENFCHSCLTLVESNCSLL
jgi:hypothetical protein